MGAVLKCTAWKALENIMQRERCHFYEMPIISKSVDTELMLEVARASGKGELETDF